MFLTQNLQIQLFPPIHQAWPLFASFDLYYMFGIEPFVIQNATKTGEMEVL
jgi:hypothetical protein